MCYVCVFLCESHPYSCWMIWVCVAWCKYMYTVTWDGDVCVTRPCVSFRDCCRLQGDPVRKGHIAQCGLEPAPSMVTHRPLGAHCLPGCPPQAPAPALRDRYSGDFSVAKQIRSTTSTISISNIYMSLPYQRFFQQYKSLFEKVTNPKPIQPFLLTLSKWRLFWFENCHSYE